MLIISIDYYTIDNISIILYIYYLFYVINKVLIHYSINIITKLSYYI